MLSYCCGGRESSQWLWPHCCGVLQWQCCPTVVVAERADLNEVTDNRDFTVMSCWDPPSQWVHNCPFSPSGSQCLYPLYIYIIKIFFSPKLILPCFIYIYKKKVFVFFSHPNSYFLADWVTYGSIIIVHIIHRTYRQNKQDTTHTHTHALSLAHTHTHIHSHSLKNSRLSLVCIPVSH